MMMLLMMQKALYIAICKKHSSLDCKSKEELRHFFVQILCFHAYDDDDADEKSIIHCNMLNVQFFSL